MGHRGSPTQLKTVVIRRSNGVLAQIEQAEGLGVDVVLGMLRSGMANAGRL